tara:strand:- start:29412 stop:30434 length:1023 start_codon:yes stop_codon:yes gene_type:complete
MAAGLTAALTTAGPLVAKYGPAMFSSAMSFKQAADANTMAEKARLESERLMEEAKKKIEINRMEGLTLPNIAYAQQSDDLNQSTAQAIQGLQESGDVRAIIGGTQGVQAANVEATQEMRANKEERLADINEKKLEEAAAIDQQLAAMDVAGAQDQAQITADAEEARANATKSIVSSLGSLGKTFLADQNLFPDAKVSSQVIANSKDPQYIKALEKYGFSVTEYLDDPDGVLKKISLQTNQNLPEPPKPDTFTVKENEEVLPITEEIVETEEDDEDEVNTKQVLNKIAPEKYAQIYNKGRKVVLRGDRRIPANNNDFMNSNLSYNNQMNINDRLKRFGLSR